MAEDLEVLRAGRERLRVGTYQSIGTYILPSLVRAFRTAHPETTLDVSEPETDVELFEMVQRGELDLSFALLPPPSQIESIELLRDPYVLVVAADSPLADRGDVMRVDELAELPLVGFKTCRGEQWLQSHIEAAGFHPTWVFRSDDNTTIQAMAAAGIGCALVPRLTVDPAHQATVIIELAAIPPRRLGLVWHAARPLSAAADSFVALAREATDAFRRRAFVSGAS
jgi:DNA-binding transcriptional LysR family regulator